MYESTEYKPEYESIIYKPAYESKTYKSVYKPITADIRKIKKFMKSHVLLAFEIERLCKVKSHLLKKANYHKEEYDKLWEASQTTLKDYYKLLESISAHETKITTMTEEYSQL